MKGRFVVVVVVVLRLGLIGMAVVMRLSWLAVWPRGFDYVRRRGVRMGDRGVQVVRTVVARLEIASCCNGASSLSDAAVLLHSVCHLGQNTHNT